jgi:hypothetical protein
VSSYRFINVSVELVSAAAVPGFGREGHLLLLWGSGAYRADDLRLALIDLRDPALWSYLLDDEPFDVGNLGLRYFTGLCGSAPVWSWHEEDARPLVFPGAIGELSVRWVREISRYVLLTMSGPEDRLGSTVVMRVALRPGGPWSRRRVVFEWRADGMGKRPGAQRFIHRAGPPDDRVGDCIFREQCDSSGVAYAPYLFDAAADDVAITLRYSLSTWNPYQSMLMTHTITRDELRRLESDL